MVTPLGLTKAHILLKVPDGERKEFISKPHDVTNGQQKTVCDMTVKELKKVITKNCGTKNKDTLTPVRRPNPQKYLNALALVQKQIDGILGYLEDNAKVSDVTGEFHDSICSLSEKIGKCVSLVNSKALNETEIKNI